MIVKKHTNIVQANQLIENRPAFTKDETRLFLTVIGSINKDDTDFNLLKIPVMEFADLWGIDHRNAYTTIKSALRGLRNKEFFIEGVNPETGKLRFITSSSISTAIYEEGQGYAMVEISSAFKPYLLALKEKYTSYVLKNIMDLSTVNAIRNYELLKQYQIAGTRTFDIEKYKKMLNIEGKYPVNADLKRYVIEPSLEEINTKTDILVSYKIIGRGKSAQISFFIKKQKIEAQALGSIDRETRKIEWVNDNGQEEFYALEPNEVIYFDSSTNEYKIICVTPEQLELSDEDLIKDYLWMKKCQKQCDAERLERETEAIDKALNENAEIDPNQLSFLNQVYSDVDYGDEKLELLADACEREFSPAQMNELYDLIKDMRLVESKIKNDIELAMFDYLQKKYEDLKKRSEREDLKPLSNRFGYLKKLIGLDLE